MNVISLAVIVVFFSALLTGSLSSPSSSELLSKQVYQEQTKYVSTLSEQALINAVVTAENRAVNATFLYDLLPDDERDFFVMNSFRKGQQILRLRCWGSYGGKPPKVSGGTVFLGNRYEVFRTAIRPELNNGHSLLLKVTGDGRVLFSRVLNADTAEFPLELDVRGVEYLTLEISTNDHNDSRNPGIYLDTPYFY